jgi:hypothetical protein
LFLSEIVEWSENGKMAKIEYKNQVIRAGRDRFRTYKDSDEVQVNFCFVDCPFVFLILSLIYVILRLLLYILFLNKYLNVKANNIKAAVEAFYQSNLLSNQRKANERERLEREQQRRSQR